jgi:hypothetical protein
MWVENFHVFFCPLHTGLNLSDELLERLTGLEDISNNISTNELFGFFKTACFKKPER